MHCGSVAGKRQQRVGLSPVLDPSHLTPIEQLTSKHVTSANHKLKSTSQFVGVDAVAFPRYTLWESPLYSIV